MTESFKFAGFTFPRKVPMLRRITARQPARRDAMGEILPRRMRAEWSFAYRTSPRPLPREVADFYLESDFAPGLRWQCCDEVEGVRIDHHGWFTDSIFQEDTIRGVVLRLPHGRGFLAGWSMGKGMASKISRRIYPDEVNAAHAADSMAEAAAEAEREYQDGIRAGRDAREAFAEGMGAAVTSMQAAREAMRAAREAMRAALSMREGEAAGFIPPDFLVMRRRDYRAALERSRDAREAAEGAREEAWREVWAARDNRESGAFAEGWRE